MEFEFIRHGDVVLRKVDELIGNPVKKNKTILAFGEVTGHKHMLSGQILESVFEGKRYVEVKESVLTHEEHDTLSIPDGKYEVLFQREVDLLGEMRQVMD